MLWKQLLNSVSEILWVSDLRKKETRRQKNVRGWSKRFLYLQYFRSLEKSRRAGCPGMLDVFSGWVWWNHISGETEVKGSLAWRQWVEALSPCFVIAFHAAWSNVHLPLFSRCYRVFSMALASSVPRGLQWSSHWIWSTFKIEIKYVHCFGIRPLHGPWTAVLQVSSSKCGKLLIVLDRVVKAVSSTGVRAVLQKSATCCCSVVKRRLLL